MTAWLLAAAIYIATMSCELAIAQVPPAPSDGIPASPTGTTGSAPNVFSQGVPDPLAPNYAPPANEWVPPIVNPIPNLLNAIRTPRPEADITKPGPDMGDYPNSAYTLPKGQIYVEMAPVTIQSADKENSASYNFPYLLRYGVTDNVELRFIGNGMTTVFDSTGTVIGISPMIIDTKVHLWDDQIKRFIPAASLEVYLQTNWGSPSFQGGVQPSLNMNLDFPFTKKTNVEMTFGYTGVQDAFSLKSGSRFLPRFNHLIAGIHIPGLDTNQFSYQWAIEHQLTEKFQVFLHGYYNGPILFQAGPGKVIGVGYFYQFNKRSTVFNSYNAGVDTSAAPFSTQFGLAFAF